MTRDLSVSSASRLLFGYNIFQSSLQLQEGNCDTAVNAIFTESWL
jgi:hypothetical protein